MAAMKITLAVAAISAVLLSTASAATYGVGEPGSAWTLGVDYGNWVSDKKFHPGDELVFKYAQGAHDVVEVSKADYNSCSSASPIATFTSGNDVVPLNATGTRYFICGITGHCSPTTTVTMKVTIDVVPGSSSPSSPMPAAGPGASNPPPPSSASAATYGVGEPGSAWTLGVDYGNWVSDKKFHPGDELVFKYAQGAHDVVEVSKADYDSCSSASPIATFTSGNDVVPLNATGTRYFICGITGHCSPTTTVTMKVTIDVVPGSSSPSSPMPAAGPGASNPPPPSSPATSIGATAGFGLVALLAAGLMA